MALTFEQDYVITTMQNNTHGLFSIEFLERVNVAFGVSIKAEMYKADGDTNPKGLTLDSGEPFALGIACFDLAPMICRALNVSYVGCIGRGFQVRACCEALRKKFV